MVMVMGEPCALAAKMKKGRMAWKTSWILAAEEAAILMVRFVIDPGRIFGVNENVLLPTKQSFSSAAVAWARQAMQAAC